MDRRPALRLEGKVAIVTGAGSVGGEGIGNGKATAMLFAREGAKVVLVDRVALWAEDTRSMIAGEGCEAIVVEADVSEPGQCQGVVDTCIRSYSRLDVLFNNVGRGFSGTVLDATDDAWQQANNVNVMSMVYMSRCAIPHMKAAGGGSIINVSSTTALRPKRMAPYTVSKSAVIGLTQAMAMDHAADRIRVNCIMPGLIYSPRVARRVTSEEREIRRTSTPLQVEGKAWDIAWAAVYLASDEARWVTGVVLPVDGGFLLTSAPNPPTG